MEGGARLWRDAAECRICAWRDRGARGGGRIDVVADLALLPPDLTTSQVGRSLQPSLEYFCGSGNGPRARSIP